MSNKKSSEELKGLAREQLVGKYGTAIGMLILISAISIGISMLVQLLLGDSLVGTTFTTADVLYLLINLVVSLLMSVFTLGFNRFYLNIARNKTCKFEDLFWGFRNHPDKIILLTLLTSFIYILCVLPGYLLIIFSLISEVWVLAIVGLIFLLIGIIIGIIVLLRFSVSSFILTDDPNKGVIESLKESAALMDGNKGRCFYIMISFFGWYLLTILSCGIGYLWITPYVSTTFANFYLDLKSTEDYNQSQSFQ